MAKRSLLLVDGDARSLRVLEVSLRKAGFVVTTAANGRDGLEKARVALPDLILSDTDMPEMDGFELCRAVKADPDLARVPFVFLTGQTEIENKIRGLELGVDEYLTKPIYIKEILTRIRLLLQKQQRDTIETRRDSNTRFAGTLHDMGVVDLIQTIEVGRKSGLIHFSGPDGRQGTIYFRNGSVIDAEAGHLQGADAVYRLLTWSEGEFELLFRTVRRKDSIDTATPGLLMEGMRRLDEWGRLLEQLPPLATWFEVDVAALAERLADLPDELNDILRLFDGRRSVLDVLDLARVGDLECLELVSRLYFEELLLEVDGGSDAGDSGSDLALEGWLGKKVPPTSELPILEPAPGEVATDAAAEWDSSGAEPSVEEVWPSLAADAAREDDGAADPPDDAPNDDAVVADEGPTPPSSRASLVGVGAAGPLYGASNGANGAAGSNGTGAADAVDRVDLAADPSAIGDEPRVEFRPRRSTGSPVAASPSELPPPETESPGAPGPASSPGGEPGAGSRVDAAAAGRARVRTPSGGLAVVPPGDPSSVSGRLHALSLGVEADEPAASDTAGPPDARPGLRARSPSGSPSVGVGPIGAVAVSVPGGLAGAGAAGSVTAAPSRIAGGGTSLLGRAAGSPRPPSRPTPVGGAGLVEGMDQAFDTSDRTPLPDPVPLGEERSNPGIKSSFGAEVATVSGELAARRYPRLTDAVGPEMVGVAPLQGSERVDRSRTGDGRLGRADLRPSVELDQELSASAEVVQTIARRRSSTGSGIGSGTTLADEEVTRPRRRAASLGAVGGDEAAPVMPVVPQPPRVSSMLRAASGRPFARTFVVTVAAATLVGALFGLLFWWLGSRDSASVAAGSAAATSSPTPVEPVARGAPVGRGGGSLPGTPPATDDGPGLTLAAAPAGEPPAAADPSSARSGDPSAPSAPSEPAAEVLDAADYDELYAQARQARRRRDYAAALDLATRAARLDPTVQARTLEAEALLRLGQADRALAVVGDAVAQKPRHAPAWYIKGKIHRALGQIDEARAALNEYLRLDPEGSRADQVIDLLQDM